jgi:hypothetical protein
MIKSLLSAYSSMTGVVLLVSTGLTACSSGEGPGDVASTATTADALAVRGGDDAFVPAKCASHPTLLVNASTWAPTGTSGVTTPGLGVSATDVYFVVDTETACSLPPPGTDAGGTSSGCGWTGNLRRVPVRGGPVTNVGTTYGEISEHLSVTSDDVVFGAATDVGKQPTASDTFLFRLPLAGGEATKITRTVGLPFEVVTDATSAYFDDSRGVLSAPLAGGASSLLSTVAAPSFVPLGDDLFLADYEGGEILSVPLAGGDAVTVATHQSGPLYPLACGGALCWMNAGVMTGTRAFEGFIEEARKKSVTPLSVGESLFHPAGFVFDGTSFYSAGSVLARTPAAGGKAETFVSLGSPAGSLVQDADCLYWSTTGGGIYSLAKSAVGPFSVE